MKDKSRQAIASAKYSKSPHGIAKRKSYNSSVATKERKKKWRFNWHRTVHGRFLSSRQEAKCKNKVWALSEIDYSLLIEKSCYYCGGLLSVSGIGLDRIDTSKGYELGNVLPCCTNCNRLRNNFLSVEETVFLINALHKFRLENSLQKSILAGMYYL